MPRNPYKSVRQVTCTLPIDLADRMDEAGMKPSALLKVAVESALAGADPAALGERLTALEKRMRQVVRDLRQLQTEMQAVNAIRVDPYGHIEGVTGPTAVR